MNFKCNFAKIKNKIFSRFCWTCYFRLINQPKYREYYSSFQNQIWRTYTLDSESNLGSPRFRQILVPVIYIYIYLYKLCVSNWSRYLCNYIPGTVLCTSVSDPGPFVRIGLFFLSPDPDRTKSGYDPEKSGSGSVSTILKNFNIIFCILKSQHYPFWSGASKTLSKNII